MKKLTIFGSGLLLLAATSCGSNSGETSTSDSTTTSTNTTAPADNSNMNTGTTQGAISDSNGSTRQPGEDTGAIHQNTSQPGTLPSGSGR